VIQQVISIAKEASKAILEIYDTDFNIEIKEDDSPVTKADLVANKIIIDGLSKISNYPIVTEESYVSYDIRKNWSKFWLVDPLDGTKDFIAKNVIDNDLKVTAGAITDNPKNENKNEDYQNDLSATVADFIKDME